MDHVVAFRAAKNAAQSRLDKPIPLNHVANWMPLIPAINRSRGNVAWANHFPTLSAADGSLVKKEMLLDPKYFTTNLTQNVEDFGSVSLLRYCFMVDKALYNVGLNEYIELNRSKKVLLLTTMLDDIAKALNIDISEDLINQVIFEERF